ncbi:complement C1q tumor necrosis factor-related protein 2-like [Ptychodera flava]|uniref:complement C1q tumor necrosis factor-related protein 2-like n=1 Tax=Ptychodera flava TaxID=63121 RepID=UPI00396A1DD7
MDHIMSVLFLVFMIHTSTAQVNDENGHSECLSICAESWPDTRGPIGPPGPPGAPGISGPVGRQGQPGVIGPAGTQGVKGQPGEKGIKGDEGDKGERGYTGVKGQAGMPGKVGPQGPKGEGGRDGNDGAKGQTGTAGVKGQKGEKCEQVKVAFTVVRKSCMIGISGSEQTITYTEVIVNVNANISINTGVFTCEVPGIYYFSFTFRSNSGKDLSIRLKKNNDNIFEMYQTSVSDYIMNSQSCMLHLNQGDQVKLVLKSGTYSFWYSSYDSHCNTFNGFLIYPD